MKKRVYKAGVILTLTVLFSICKGLGFQAFAFDTLNIDYNCGDQTFFHSDYISDITDSYRNCDIINNGEENGKNSIILHRCGENRYDPNRTDNSIEMVKNSRYDCYFDVKNIAEYPYYIVRGRAKTEHMGALLRLCSYKAYVDSDIKIFHMLDISADGKIMDANGRQLGSVTEGRWISYAVAFDMVGHKADIYIDGVRKSTVAIDARIQKLECVRFWIYHDDKEKDPPDGILNGDLYLDEVEVTGMCLPYTGDETNYTSVLYDDTPVKEYLTGKTVYNAENGCVFFQGEKTVPAMTLEYDEEKDELYGDYRALNAGFGFKTVWENQCISDEHIRITAKGVVVYHGMLYDFSDKIKYKGDQLLVPIKSLAKAVLGKEIFEDGNGIFIFSDTPVDLDLDSELPEYMTPLQTVYPHTDIKSINWYMTFTRPSAEQIKADFQANNPGHPRLLATAKDFAYVKSEYQRTGSSLNPICTYLIQKADAVLGLSVLEYQLPDKQRILNISREMQRRMELLGFAYQVTGNTKYVDCAWKNLSKVMSYPDWNPSHMIDVGEMNYAFAIAYDWMYDAFTSEQRTALYQGVRSYGMEVTRLCYYGRVPNWGQWANRTDAFVRWKSNFNAVINCGALAASMAFAENDMDFFFDVAQKAIRSLEYTMIGFDPDGTWIEGAGYWNYTISYLSKGVGSIITTLGTDYGLMDCSGVEESPVWYRSLCSWQGSNNFHDAGVENFSYEYFPWLAKVYQNKSFASTRKAAIKRFGNYTVYDAIWYLSGVSDTESGYALYDSFRGIESVTARSSFGDQNAMYFSAHAGQVFCYHSQADVGTFIFDALGQRWACDLGSEDYNVQRDGGLKYYGSYRRRAEAHNVVVINPNISDADGGQKNDAFVPLVRADETDYGSFTEYDMTPAYADYTDFYRRQFHTVTDANTLVVTDVISLKEKSDVCWFMTTKADVSWTDATHFVLSSGGKTMYGSVDINCSDFTSETTACKPLLGAPVLEGQNTNAGYSRVVIRANAEGLLKIRVTLSPDKNYNPYTISDVKDYIIRDFSVYDGETVLDRTFSEGVCKANASGYFYGEEESCLIMAQYDNDGVLRDAAVSGIGSLSGHITAVTAELPVQALENSMLKVFVWDKNSLVPLERPKKLQYQPK